MHISHSHQSTKPARISRGRLSLKLACTAVLTGASVQAASLFWFGDSDGFWNTIAGPAGTNWSSSGDFNQGTAGIPGSSDDVFFNLAGAGNLNTQLGADFAIRSLNFTPLATTPVTIGGGNLLTIGSGGVTHNGSATVTVSSAVALGASQRWTNNSASEYTQSGVISGAAANALTIAGSGKFNFTNANTYAGATSVFTGSLTLSGAGSILNTSGIALGAGTALTLDSSAVQNANRISDGTTITSSGGIIRLIGNASGTVETVGTLGVASGASVVQATGSGSGFIFGAAGVTPSFNRSRGGTVLFAIDPGSIVAAPNVTLSNGIIGGWAVTGTSAGAGLNFATTDGSGLVVPFTAYSPFTAGSVSTDNAKYDAGSGSTVNLTANTTVNSLFLTGGSTPVNGSGVIPPASYVVNGTGSATPTRAYGNGITFSNGAAGVRTVTLTVGSGGIISSGATGTGFYNNKADIPNMAFIGYLFDESGGANGNVTTGAGVPDLIVYTDSNLRIASIITDNGSPVGLTKSGPGLLDLSNGNNQNAKHSNTFSGKVTINEGVLLINAAGQLGGSGSAADNVTFNGGELRTFAGFTTTATQGWTVGTRGGAFSYTGGANAIITNKITGVGGFSYYARQTGGGGGAIIHLNNTQGTGGVANHDYQGATNFWFSYTDGNDGSGGNALENITFDANDQVPHNSAVTITTVRDNATHDVVPNTVGKSIDIASKYQYFGSLAGNIDIANHNSTTNGGLILGGNNLSTAFIGSIYGTNNTTAGAGSLTKVGTGTQTLSGTNNRFSGATSIVGGTLLIGSGTALTSTAALFNSPVSVGNGTLFGTLGGNGTINSAVTVTSTGHLSPDMSATTFNTLTINNNLTINAGGGLDYNFGSPGNGDLVSITGTGNLLMNAGGDVLNITQLASSGFGIGTYPLIKVIGSGTFTDNATFTINGKPNFNYSVLKPGDAIDAAAGGGAVPAGTLLLQVLAGNPLLTWTGAVNGSWDTGTANWTGDNNVFSTGANVTFDEFGAARPGVVVTAGGVSANTITLANSATSYDFSGGAITVTAGAGVSKSQAGNVTFNTNVTTPITATSGGTFTVGAGRTYASTAKFDVNGGTLTVAGTLNTPALNVKTGAALNVSSLGALGSTTALDVAGSAIFLGSTQTLGALTGVASGTVNLAGPTELSLSSGAFDGTIAGVGGVTKIGAGVLALTGANTFSGSVAVKNGTLSVPGFAATGTPQPLGAGTSDLVLGDVATAGTLRYTGNGATTQRGITLAAGGGGLESAAPGQLFSVGGTVVNGAAPLTLLGAGNGSITSPLTGSGNVTKQDAGTWTLAGTSAPSGATATTVFTIQSGTLAALSDGNNSALGAGTVTLNGGTLGLSGTTFATFDNAVTVAQNATIQGLQATGGAANQFVQIGGTKNVTVAAGKVVTLGTANGYTLNVAGNITGAGGVTSTGTVNLNGATNNFAGPLVVSGGVFSVNGGLAIPSTASVSGGVFNANVPISVNNLVVSGGTYNGSAALISAGPVSITGGIAHVTAATGGIGSTTVNVTGGTLQFDAGFGGSASFAGTGITNDSVLQVKSGVADLGNIVIGTTKPHATAGPADQLQGRYFRPGDVGVGDFTGANGDPFISFENGNTFRTLTPGAIGTLTNVNLNFNGGDIQTRANAIVPNFYANTDNEGVAWVGRLNVGGANLPAGDISFGTNSDDGSSIYIDLNQNGIFETNERVIGNLGPHGVVTVTNTVNLAAGSYKFAIGYYNGTGGAQIDAKFAIGSGVAFATQAFINPGSATQLGVFSAPNTPGGQLRIDDSGTLSAGGFTADAITFTGGSGSLVLKSHAAPLASAADSITLQSDFTQGTLDLAAGNAVTIGVVNLGNNGGLVKTGAGSLAIAGAGTGTGSVSVAGGPLFVNGSITGSVNVNAGMLGGTGRVVGPTTVAAGATIAPGVVGTGTLATGDFNLSAPTAHLSIELGGTTIGSFDRLNVTGAVSLSGDLLSSIIGGFTPAVNDTFFIILNDGGDSVFGTFANAANNGNGTGTIDYGNNFRVLVNYSADAATSNFAVGSGNDVAVQLLSIPEPGSLGLLLAAVAGLGLRRRGGARRHGHLVVGVV